MDALFRGGRVLLIAAVCAGACAPRWREPVGTSLGGRARAPAPPASASAAPARLEGLPADFRARWPRVGAVALSGHGSGGWSDVVYGSPEAKEALAGGAAVPVGGVLAADHSAAGADAGATRGPVFLMERRADGWRFAVATPAGMTLADGAPDAGVPLVNCARCHADAPQDGVFPVPR